MSEKQAVLPELRGRLSLDWDDLAKSHEYTSFVAETLADALTERERQLLTLLQSLAGAGIEIKDGKVVSPWISAEHKKPQAGQDILFEVPSCYGVEKGMFHPNLKEPWMSDRTSPYNDLVHFSNQEVTWWMLLPSPPTDSTKEVPDTHCDTCGMTPDGHAYDCPEAQE